MSTLAVPRSVSDRMVGLLAEAGLPPAENQGAPEADRTFVWEPDLSNGDLQTANHLLILAKSGLPISAAEFSAIRDDLVTLRDFRARQSAPTNAQVLAAIDSLIDVLRVIFQE